MFHDFRRRKQVLSTQGFGFSSDIHLSLLFYHSLQVIQSTKFIIIGSYCAHHLLLLNPTSHLINLVTLIFFSTYYFTNRFIFFLTYYFTNRLQEVGGDKILTFPKVVAPKRFWNKVAEYWMNENHNVSTISVCRKVTYIVLHSINQWTIYIYNPLIFNF